MNSIEKNRITVTNLGKAQLIQMNDIMKKRGVGFTQKQKIKDLSKSTNDLQTSNTTFQKKTAIKTMVRTDTKLIIDSKKTEMEETSPIIKKAKLLAGGKLDFLENNEKFYNQLVPTIYASQFIAQISQGKNVKLKDFRINSSKSGIFGNNKSIMNEATTKTNNFFQTNKSSDKDGYLDLPHNNVHNKNPKNTNKGLMKSNFYSTSSNLNKNRMLTNSPREINISLIKNKSNNNRKVSEQYEGLPKFIDFLDAKQYKDEFSEKFKKKIVNNYEKERDTYLALTHMEDQQETLEKKMNAMQTSSHEDYLQLNNKVKGIAKKNKQNRLNPLNFESDFKKFNDEYKYYNDFFKNHTMNEYRKFKSIKNKFIQEFKDKGMTSDKNITCYVNHNKSRNKENSKMENSYKTKMENSYKKKDEVDHEVQFLGLNRLATISQTSLL